MAEPQGPRVSAPENHADVAIVVIEPSGLVLGVDEALLRLTGFKRMEVERHDFHQVVDFDDPIIEQSDTLHGIQRTVSGAVVARDGTRTPARLTLAPALDGQAGLSAITIVIRPTSDAWQSNLLVLLASVATAPRSGPGPLIAAEESSDDGER